MTARSREVDFLSVKSVFRCPNCENEVTLNAGGTMGVYFAVGLLGTFILSFILWGSRGGYDLAASAKTLILLVLFTLPVWWAWFKARQYPVTGVRAITEEEKAVLSTVAEAEPLQRGLAFLDKLSPYKTFLIVLICVAVFLGAAALIGWINFTYFDDRLFG
jgi:hypothetical protein